MKNSNTKKRSIEQKDDERLWNESNCHAALDSPVVIKDEIQLKEMTFKLSQRKRELRR